MTTLTTICELCGRQAPDVEYRWAWYRDSREPVQVIWRCRREEDCQRRVESTGASWPLVSKGAEVGGAR